MNYELTIQLKKEIDKRKERVAQAIVVVILFVVLMIQVFNENTITSKAMIHEVIPAEITSCMEKVDSEIDFDSGSNKATDFAFAGISAEIFKCLRKITLSAGVSADIAECIEVATIKAKELETVEEGSYIEKGFPQYADEEWFLACIIELEAGKSETDRIYTGSVVINRARTNYKDFRNVHTLHEVFYQGNQYHLDTRAKMPSCVPSEKALKVAKGLISGEIECLEENILFQTSKKKPWMYGEIGDANLPGAIQYYGYPLDYEEGC